MQKEDLNGWRIDRLKDEIVNLSDKNFNLECRIKQLEESEGRWKCENKSLIDENKELKHRIENLEVDSKSKIDNPKFDNEIIRLTDQHNQDCIRINDLTTTVYVLAGLYSTLRKNVGMD